jgi:hypothetical protein
MSDIDEPQEWGCRVRRGAGLSRHCKERSDETIQPCAEGAPAKALGLRWFSQRACRRAAGLLRFARNDAQGVGSASTSMPLLRSKMSLNDAGPAEANPPSVDVVKNTNARHVRRRRSGRYVAGSRCARLAQQSQAGDACGEPRAPALVASLTGSLHTCAESSFDAPVGVPMTENKHIPSSALKDSPYFSRPYNPPPLPADLRIYDKNNLCGRAPDDPIAEQTIGTSWLSLRRLRQGVTCAAVLVIATVLLWAFGRG